MRILLVENNPTLGEGMTAALRQQGYTVDWLQDVHSVSYAISQEPFDAVLLDLSLPNHSSLNILTDLRKRDVGVPIMILTTKNSIEDRIAGLDAGADDYLIKPFDFNELFARLRALLRRPKKMVSPVLKYGNVTLDVASRMAFSGSTQVNLSRREFSLLKKLLENQSCVLTKEQLIQSIYGWNDHIDSNTLEVYVHHLRKKFGSNLPIDTVRGVGYAIRKSV